jgi:hypothetical protein
MSSAKPKPARFIHSVIDKIDNIMPAPVEVEMKG